MELDFQDIVNNITSPVIVVHPIYEGETIVDFSVVYKNDALVECAGHVIGNCKKWSEFETKITSDIKWFEMAISTLNEKKCQDATYYSAATKNWYKVDLKKAKDNFLIITFTNITPEKIFTQKIKEAERRDNLTGLINRGGFSDEFDVALENARYEKTMIGILGIDIDDLREINDSKGNKAGDEILKRSADILKRFERDSIKIFRYGGDEFVVLILNAKTKDSITNITDTIYEAFQTEGIPVSGGISLFPDFSQQKDELMRFADMAMHCVKSEGKNRFDFFSIEMEKEFIRQLTMQAKLSAAVENANFSLYYQPQFDINTSQLRGFEALLRWKDKELGEVGPAVFIPLAEENGLIVPIGNWVLETALKTLKRWQDEYKFMGIMSVNVSPIQLHQEDFLPNLKRIISENKIIPEYLEIEITEGVVIRNVGDAIKILNDVQKLGIRISLDDFGTGYSSLSYLQSLPLNTLKIDKSFIKNIANSDGIQANITSSIINMVTNMGLETIAEGVEESEQLSVLKNFHCTFFQGFLKGKPMPLNLCDAYLSGDKSALLTNAN